MASAFQVFSQTYDAFYKSIRTSRGLTYRYLSVPGTNGTALLWLHGFPSSVFDWRHQLDHFRAKGYALIAPDMLGYGGTDKPADSAMYKRSALTDDIMEIVNIEAPTGAVVAIAHDHGVNVLSRLMDVHTDRFAAFAFLAAGYIAPRPGVPYQIELVLALQEKHLGKALFAYWEFFTKPDAAQKSAENFESFYDLLYAKDAVEVWTDVLLSRGKAAEWIEGSKRCERGSFVDDEDFAVSRDHLIGPGRGLTGPLNWYRVSTDGFNQQDDKEVVEKLGNKLPLKLSKPVYFAATARDAVCNPVYMRIGFNGVALDLTVGEFDTSHWVYLEQPALLNESLEKWILEKVPPGKA